jgi:hypothetical protein
VSPCYVRSADRGRTSRPLWSKRASSVSGQDAARISHQASSAVELPSCAA